MSTVFVAASKLPTPHGTFTMHGFQDEATGKEHLALTMGDVGSGDPVLGRIHSECLTGDAFGSMRCDCGPQLEAAMDAVAKRRPRYYSVPASGRPWHWSAEQSAGLRAAG